MGALTALRKLAGTSDHTLCECRICGTNMEDDDTECPSCGSTEIVCYDL